MNPTAFTDQIARVAAETDLGTATARKTGRTTTYPYVPVVRTTDPTTGTVRTKQILGRAFPTREEAVAYAEREIAARRTSLAEMLARPRHGALREQHGLPREIPVDAAPATPDPTTVAAYASQVAEIAVRVREILESDETRADDCEYLLEMLAETDEYAQISAIEAVRTGWLPTDAQTRAIARAIILEVAPELIADDDPEDVAYATAEILAAVGRGDEAYLCSGGSVVLVVIDEIGADSPNAIAHEAGSAETFLCPLLRISAID